MEAGSDEARIKALMKEAVLEVLTEQRELLISAVEEALENVALIRAIDLTAQDDVVTRPS